MRHLPPVRSKAIVKLRHNHCISRSGLTRKLHEWDKDGRCIFCDFLLPEFCELLRCGCVMVRSDYAEWPSLWRTHYGTIHCKHGNVYPEVT